MVLDAGGAVCSNERSLSAGLRGGNMIPVGCECEKETVIVVSDATRFRVVGVHENVRASVANTRLRFEAVSRRVAPVARVTRVTKTRVMRRMFLGLNIPAPQPRHEDVHSI